MSYLGARQLAYLRREIDYEDEHRTGHFNKVEDRRIYNRGKKTK